MQKKKCFVIMPISTPEDKYDVYSDDKDHFKHVLKHLFIPAIKKLDFEPVEPIVKGSEIIHADIISNIENSDYVLCDMSLLNPNVFFELGIRTAINKPIALVKDSVTKKIPFDTNIINNYTYSHRLEPWTLDKEIQNLSDHLTECFSDNKTSNSLWRYFSISSVASPIDQQPNQEDKLEYLSMQIEALRNTIEPSTLNTTILHKKNIDPDDALVDVLVEMVNKDGKIVNSYSYGNGIIVFEIEGHLSENTKEAMSLLAKGFNNKLIIES